MVRPTLLDQPPGGQAAAGHAAAGESRAPTADAVQPRRAGRTGRWWGRRYWIVGGVVVAVVLLAATSLAVSLHALSRPTVSAGAVNATIDSRVGSAVNSLQSQPPAGVVVYQQIAPAMVVIQASIPGARSEESLGAGVIVSNTGEILTALHVVEGATSIKVAFSDGTTSTAVIRSADSSHDIASLTPRHPPGVVVPAVLGGGVQIGDEVFAVGHPLGLVDTLTAGVVSGLGRTFKGTNGRTLAGLIQFDAAVNPGNSGGPLLNRQGQVVGIVTGIANPARVDDFAGISFAVPITTAGGAAGAPTK